MLIAICVNRRYMMGLDQQWTKLFALPFAPANRKRAERYSMVALTAGDDEPSLRLATLNEILPREFERRLDGFRATAHIKNAIKARWRVRYELISQLLCGLRREEAGMGVSELIELSVHRRQHVRMRVAEAGHRRTTACVDVFLAGAIADHDPASRAGDRVGVANLTMKNAGHACCFEAAPQYRIGLALFSVSLQQLCQERTRCAVGCERT